MWKQFLFQRKNSTVNDKSFAIGTIAETLEELGSVTSQFVAKLYPVLMSHVRDEDEEVRNNAVYGLGVMSAHGGAAIIGYLSNSCICWLKLMLIKKFLLIVTDDTISMQFKVSFHLYINPCFETFVVTMERFWRFCPMRSLRKRIEGSWTTSAERCVVWLQQALIRFQSHR